MRREHIQQVPVPSFMNVNTRRRDNQILRCLAAKKSSQK